METDPYHLPLQKATSVLMLAGLAFTSCSAEKPLLEADATCYASTVGPLANNIRAAGLHLLQDYYGATDTSKYTGLKAAAEVLKDNLNKQRTAKRSSTAYTPNASDVISFCLLPKDPSNPNAGGYIQPGAVMRAVDDIKDLPEPYRDLPEGAVYQIDLNGRRIATVLPKGQR